MVAISAFRVTQHSQIFSLSFRNRIQCIALYQLHKSRLHGYFIEVENALCGAQFRYSSKSSTSTFIKLQNESLPKDIGQELLKINNSVSRVPVSSSP